MRYSTPQPAQEQAAPSIDDALENESPNRTKVNLLAHKPASVTQVQHAFSALLIICLMPYN